MSDPGTASQNVSSTFADKIIGSESLSEILDVAAKSSQVYVPVKTGSTTEFALLSDAPRHNPKGGPTRLSPKSFFFPQTETLYTFDFDTIEPGSLDAATQRENPAVLFGVRPCDAASFTLLDQVFGIENHGYDDPYYESRRNNTTVISLSCNAPCSTCFCTSVGGDPAGTRGSDIVATELEGKFYLRIVSQRGSDFLEAFGDAIKDPDKGDRDDADSRAKHARESMTEVPYDPAKTKVKFDEAFEHPAWETVTNTCIGCGACTYLCPTCHCFDIADEERHYKGRRIRTWDSCQYPSFTKHASGHNPRPTKVQRLRQRFMHKFSYTVETVNEVYCVGCGRCVQHCPVNLDIREVLREFSAK